MSALRRTLARFSSTNAKSALPRTVERFDLNTVEEDAATVLPPYSPCARQTTAEFTAMQPPPSYFSTCERHAPTDLLPPPYPTSPSIVDRRSKLEERRRMIDDHVRRIRSVVENPAAWRDQGNGEKTFFWALRCPAGTADVLYAHTTEIRDRVLRGGDLRVEKFCFMFRGQKLVNLWCRPIQSEVSSLCSSPNSDFFRNMALMPIL
jgi:hypothetical protein